MSDKWLDAKHYKNSGVTNPIELVNAIASPNNKKSPFVVDISGDENQAQLTMRFDKLLELSAAVFDEVIDKGLQVFGLNNILNKEEITEAKNKVFQKTNTDTITISKEVQGEAFQNISKKVEELAKEFDFACFSQYQETSSIWTISFTANKNKN